MGKWRYKKKNKMFTYRQRTEIDLSKPIYSNMEQKKNNSICYLCGKVMISEEYYLSHREEFNKTPCFLHDEHIIQNALHGKLKSNSILCKSCGTILGDEIDSQFVSLFASFVERLKKFLIRKDHGSKNVITLKGHLYKDEELNEKINVQIREGKVSPIEPYYEVDESEGKVTIYANEKRAKQYKPIVQEEIKNKGANPDSFEFKSKTDIQGEGILGYFFTEGVDNFNEIIKKGFSKIAVDFAVHCGISRENMPHVIEIDSKTRMAKLKYNNCSLPFISIGTIDTIIEINRPDIEELYPTHTIILFNQKVGSRNLLYCYIDLFSTFQYYVLLNPNYTGEDIYEVFHQTIIKQEIPEIDVRRIRPKHLSIVIQEYNIDMTKYKGENLSDLYDFIEKEIKNYEVSSTLNFQNELRKIFDNISLPIALQVGGIEIPDTEEIISSINYEIPDSQKRSVIFEYHNYIEDEDNFNHQLFRRIFYENDGNGGVEIMSSPVECNSPTITNECRREYCHMKFNQLNSFITSKEKESKLEAE
ncbi:HNH endonuclease [Porphyromonadaceae bacterium]